MYVQFVGDIFLRMLKCLIIPLLVSSIVTAIGSLDLSLSKKIGFRAIVYYSTTTYLAVMQGIILVSIIRPGDGGTQVLRQKVNSRNVTTIDTTMDLIRNMFPENLIQACTQQFRTKLTFLPGRVDMNISDPYTWELGSEYSQGSNVLGLVIFSVVLGIAIGKMGELGKPLLSLFNSLGETMMVITKWVIWFSPVGILFLVSAKILEMESISVVIGQLGWYFFTVLLGLACHGLIVLPGIYTICTRQLPFRFLINMTQPLLTAFGTASRDRFHTLVNVEGDALGAGLVYHLSKEELRAMDKASYQTGKLRKISVPHKEREA